MGLDWVVMFALAWLVLDAFTDALCVALALSAIVVIKKYFGGGFNG